MTISAARAQAALDALHALGAMANAATPIKQRLMTANGSATANGTELTTGGGYTAAVGQTCTWGSATSPGTSANTAAVTYTNMPAATIVGIEEWDSTGTPVRQELGSHTSKTTVAGDTLSYAIGAVTSALA
jgi:hypothetical protein